MSVTYINNTDGEQYYENLDLKKEHVSADLFNNLPSFIDSVVSL